MIFFRGSGSRSREQKVQEEKFCMAPPELDKGRAKKAGNDPAKRQDPGTPKTY